MELDELLIELKKERNSPLNIIYDDNNGYFENHNKKISFTTFINNYNVCEFKYTEIIKEENLAISNLSTSITFVEIFNSILKIDVDGLLFYFTNFSLIKEKVWFKLLKLNPEYTIFKYKNDYSTIYYITKNLNNIEDIILNYNNKYIEHIKKEYYLQKF